MVAGDFNIVSSLEEYSGESTPDRNAINDFSSFLMQVYLHDLPTTGGIYTWIGVRQRGRVWKRHAQWLRVFPGCLVEVLHQATSDC